MQQAATHLMRAYARQPVTFARQRRAPVGRAGVEYLDAIAGVAVTSLGHGHPEIAAAIAEQAALLMHTSNVFASSGRNGWASACALAGMEKAFFCNSGAEANEAALKLARLHGHRRQVAQPQIVVMENGFHGRTLATLSATGNPAKQQGFEPCCRDSCGCRMTISPPCASWRNSATTSSPCCWSRCRARAASASPAPITCGTCALCDRHGWLLMLDEIQAGMGRTGAWFGHQHAGIAPDVMTLAKALGNGFPIGACLARGRPLTCFRQASTALPSAAIRWPAAWPARCWTSWRATACRNAPPRWASACWPGCGGRWKVIRKSWRCAARA